jgi:hypothetical protein
VDRIASRIAQVVAAVRRLRCCYGEGLTSRVRASPATAPHLPMRTGGKGPSTGREIARFTALEPSSHAKVAD